MRSPALLAASFLALVACTTETVGTGENDGNQTSALVFKGEQEPLKGFDKKIDLKADGVPAEATFEVSAAGKLSIEAGAKRDDKKLAGVPGSGKVSLDLHFKMAGHLKVETAIKTYDGDIPGLENLDIPITGSAAFDPFLLDGSSDLAATLPTVALPEIPLGSIPGSLLLTIQPESKITTTFKGVCLSVKDGKASYQGSTNTSGSLVVKATLKLDLPMPLNKSIDLPNFTVPLPSLATPLDLGSIDATDLDANDQGACGSNPGKSSPVESDAPTKSDQTDGGTDAGPIVCNAVNPSEGTFTSTTFVASTTPAPTLKGGSVVDGTYVLTALNLYGPHTDQESWPPRMKRVLKVTGNHAEYMTDYDDGYGPVTSSVTLAYAAKTMQATTTCPDNEAGPARPFETLGSTLRVLYDDTGSSDKAELVYTRQ